MQSETVPTVFIVDDDRGMRQAVQYLVESVGLRVFVESVTFSPMKIEPTSSLLAILDDDRSIQNAVQDLIESEGMSALCFGSAEQFLDSQARNDAACLIADILMPGRSGIDLQAKLKAERCRVPIIFITAHGAIPLSVSAMREGAVDFFTKPVDGIALISSVKRALQLDRVIRLEASEQARLNAKYESLTPREREVLPLLASGC